MTLHYSKAMWQSPITRNQHGLENFNHTLRHRWTQTARHKHTDTHAHTVLWLALCSRQSQQHGPQPAGGHAASMACTVHSAYVATDPAFLPRHTICHQHTVTTPLRQAHARRRQWATWWGGGRGQQYNMDESLTWCHLLPHSQPHRAGCLCASCNGPAAAW